LPAVVSSIQCEIDEVIDDVDEALRTLIQRDALDGTDVDVALDAPTKEWASRRNAPVVDLYLYDIREDLRQREFGRINVRVDGVTSERRQPPRWFKLSYLVTAWTQRPEDEHRLLSRLLSCFLRLDVIPPDVVGGHLSALGVPVRLMVATPPPEDRALSDTWSALGGDLKPSLDLVITTPFTLERPLHVGPIITEEPRFSFDIDDHEPEGVRRRTRRSMNGAKAQRAPQPASEQVRAGRTDSGRRLHVKELPRERQ
jgi:hypothetical protein